MKSSRQLRGALLLAPPFLVGALLRLWRLDRQIFLGDEMHGVKAALDLPLAEILTTYRLADHCIPLSAFYDLVMGWGVKLSEPIIRLPSVAAGLALLVALPMVLLRRPPEGRAWLRAAAAAWLIAFSPSLVYYSRFARPYAVVALLAPLAAYAFWRWWRGAPGAGHGWAVLYAAAGAATGWFFLGALPFVAAPLAWAAGDLVVSRRAEGRRGWAGLLAAGAGLAAGVAAFLLPALPSFRRLLRTKAAEAETRPDTLVDVLHLQAGTAWTPLVVVFWLLAALGLAVLLRRRPALGVYGALMVAAQWTALTLVLRPAGVGHPVILNRYVLVTLPVVLLWTAEGTAWAAARIGRPGGLRRWAGAGVAAAFVAALGGAGPYATDGGFRLGPFGGAWQGLSLDDRHTYLPPSVVPAAYHRIAAEPGDEPVVHVVDQLSAYALWPDLGFARFHGRPVILAAGQPWLDDPRLAFRTVRPVDPEAIAASGGRFVVLVLDRPYYRRFEAAVRRGEPLPEPTPTDRDHPVRAWARRAAGQLRGAWGEPHLVSEGVLVWDLARLPAAGAGAGAVTGRSPAP